MITVSIIAQYTLYKSAHSKRWAGLEDGVNQADICINATETSSNNSEISSQWQEVQDEATSAVLYSGVLTLLPNIPVVLLFGIWSDAAQKRLPQMFCPVIGKTLYALFLLLDLYVNLDNFSLLYIGALLSGISGGTITFISACAAYIADTVNLENRTKELSLLELSNSLGLAIGSLLNGYWIQLSGYKGPFWFLLGVTIIACIICLFIKEPYSNEIKNISSVGVKARLSEIFHFAWCTSELIIVLGSYFLALGIYMFIHVGQERVAALFQETSPLCFDNITIGWWLFLQGIVMSIGTFSLPRCCDRFLDDGGIVYVGLLSRAAGSLCLIFADTQYITFSGKIV